MQLLNPWNLVAKGYYDYDSSYEHKDWAFNYGATSAVFHVLAGFVLAVLCSEIWYNSALTLMVLCSLYLLSAFASIRAGARQAQTSNEPPLKRRIADGRYITTLVAKDKAINGEWRKRAKTVNALLLHCEAKVSRLSKIPDFDCSPISDVVDQLYDAATALAQYHLVAGINAHAEIIAQDIDSVLLSYKELAA